MQLHRRDARLVQVALRRFPRHEEVGLDVALFTRHRRTQVREMRRCGRAGRVHDDRRAAPERANGVEYEEERDPAVGDVDASAGVV